MEKIRGVDECSVPQRLRGPGWAQHDLDTHRNAEWKAGRRAEVNTVAVLNQPPALLFVQDATQIGGVTTCVVSCQVNRPLGEDGTAEAREYVAAGASVCDQRDEPDPYLGLRLALGRAVKDLGAQIKRDAWREVQRHPKPEAAAASAGRVTVGVDVDVRGLDELRGVLDELRTSRRALLYRVAYDAPSFSKKLRRAALKEMQKLDDE